MGSSTNLDLDGRRWDDPPVSEPPASAEKVDISVILIFKRRYRISGAIDMRQEYEVLQVAFTPSGRHAIAMTPLPTGAAGPDLPAENAHLLRIWSTMDGTIMSFPGGNHKPIASGGFACPPVPDNAIVMPFFSHINSVHVRKPNLQVFDLSKGRRRFIRPTPIQAPIAYSANGIHLAAVSSTDPSNIFVLEVINDKVTEKVTEKRKIPHHIDEVTHLAFTPDMTAVVSLSKDGTGRMTSVATGQVLRKFVTDTRHAPRLLQISPDGELVASVWGWDVMLWYPNDGAGKMVVYDVNAARHTEGWPLCISPDCQFLVCRTEEGLDVMDLTTGSFLGEITGIATGYISAAAFSQDGSQLLLGKSTGEVMEYEVIVVNS